MLIKPILEFKGKYYRIIVSLTTNISASPIGLTGSYLPVTKRRGYFKANEVRLPHVFDIIAVLAQRMSEDLTPQASNEAINPNELCVFMGAYASEAGEFMRLNPKFFFITCNLLEVNDGFPQWEVGPQTQLVVPVIWREGYYYIISGQENVPLYRIHHPKEFFFSTEGKALLLRMLARWHGDKKGAVFDPIEIRGGKQGIYCLPNIGASDGWPAELWDDLNEDEINAIIPYQLVHEPVIPLNQKYSVQLVSLNDSHNIVDVKFPNKE